MVEQTISKSLGDRALNCRSLLGLVGLLTGLTACSSMAGSSASLVAQESFQMGANYSSLGDVSAQIRQFDCSRTDKVAVQLLYIESGQSTSVWDGEHTRSAGSKPSSSCLLGLFFSEDDSSMPFVDFSFSGQLTSASGSSKNLEDLPDGSLDAFQDIDRFELSPEGVQPSPKILFKSWSALPGTRITSGQPTLLQWDSAILSTALPEVDPSTEVASVALVGGLSSVQDIVDFTRDREGAVFWVITIEPLN